LDKPVDRRGVLDAEVFTFRVSKEPREPKVFISWRGRQVVTLQGEKAEKFLHAPRRFGGRPKKRPASDGAGDRPL
jgi:hypothetical protein